MGEARLVPTHFTCVLVQKYNTDRRFAVYLSYWYKCTSSTRGAGGRSAGQEAYGGTYFTCLTGTNVLIPPAVRVEEALDKEHMEVLTLLAFLVQMYKY